MPKTYQAVRRVTKFGLLLASAVGVAAYANVATRPSAKAALSEHKPDRGSSGFPEAGFTPYQGYDPDPCYHAKDHDAADLCAQWRAALAAEKSSQEARRATNWSIVATILSAIGFFGFLYTLAQTQGALKEARRGNRNALLFEKRARRESKESSADTKTALAIAQKTSDAAVAQSNAAIKMTEMSLISERAIVSISAIRFAPADTQNDPPVSGWFFYPDIQNFGNTPAVDLKTRQTQLLLYPHDHNYSDRVTDDSEPFSDPVRKFLAGKEAMGLDHYKISNERLLEAFKIGRLFFGISLQYADLLQPDLLRSTVIEFEVVSDSDFTIPGNARFRFPVHWSETT